MIKAIAIDDEPLALSQIQRFAERIPDVTLLGAFYSTDDARRALQADSVDLIFLDIEMPDGSGVDFARSLGDNAPAIIFTTAYPQYAVEGFRLDAVDYLLKPLAFEEMEQAVAKVRRRLAENSAAGDAAAPTIYIKASGTIHRVALDDILYIKGLGEYVQIFLRGDGATPITTFDSIKRFEKELPASTFMRVHKSYLVNLRAITSATRTTASLPGATIPVGEKYRAAFLAYMRSRLG